MYTVSVYKWYIFNNHKFNEADSLMIVNNSTILIFNDIELNGTVRSNIVNSTLF